MPLPEPRTCLGGERVGVLDGHLDDPGASGVRDGARSTSFSAPRTSALSAAGAMTSGWNRMRQDAFAVQMSITPSSSRRRRRSVTVITEKLPRDS
jgi:hypothetical protein